MNFTASAAEEEAVVNGLGLPQAWCRRYMAELPAPFTPGSSLHPRVADPLSPSG